MSRQGFAARRLAPWLAAALLGGTARAETSQVEVLSGLEAPGDCRWVRGSPEEKPLLGCPEPDGTLQQALTLDGLDETALPRARAGEARAMAAIGVFYAMGPRRLRNPVLARAWFLKAAEQKDVVALTLLGDMYSSVPGGSGVGPDDAEAARWYRAAADAGVAEAAFQLGRMHVEGRGVARDPLAAIPLFVAAAEKGHALAVNNLAIIYTIGPLKDAEKARPWICRPVDAERIAEEIVESAIRLNEDLPIWATYPDDIRRQAAMSPGPLPPYSRKDCPSDLR